MNPVLIPRNTQSIISIFSICVLSVILFFCASEQMANAQTVSPIQGLGSVQFFDNNGIPLTNGVLYSYQAGTTTQQATYTDNTGTQLNPNPISFGTGGRVQIWLTTTALYKFVLCLQNDGAFCSPADVLFSVDQVPGGATSSGGGGGSPFIGIFISNTVNPATSGTLRLASGDQVCWRNAAGSANICWSKDSNDLLSWSGGSLKFPEVSAPTGAAGFDLLWADNTAHRWLASNNGGASKQLVLSGNDIDITDAVTKVHFGSTQIPFNSTVAPSSGQFLFFDGTQISGTLGITGLTQTYPNSASGTSANLLAKLVGAPSTVITTLLTDIRDVVGICSSGCGTTGNAVVAVLGATNCTFDGGTTSGDYITISSTVAGNCHDFGSTIPYGVQVIGRVLSTNAVSGTYGITLFPVFPPAAYSNGGRNSSVCSTAPPNTAGATCTTTVTLDRTEPDTNYHASIGCISQTQFPFIIGYTKTTTSVIVTLANGTGNEAFTATCGSLEVTVTR